MSFSNIANNAIGLFQPDANLEVFLILNGKEYELSQFNCDFVQHTDIKGEPQSEIKGGKLIVTIEQFPDNQIFYWAINEFSKKSGEIVFRNKTSSASLKIKFDNAYCVNMIQKIDTYTGVTSTFLISPERIYLNDNLLDNNWE
ncbi:type VI secretion system tube protein TssD [Capnocytophaga cynodegmi]|uniref:type VI secretion system tube protein TssD n=1 Tax=Capnocytophaga cynodegmi TaxID=28189 RepID=UPI00385DD679